MPLMKEYKTVSIKTDQGWGGAKGTADTEAIDRVLNLMSTEGWELFCVQDLQHTSGSASLLCIFVREKRA